MNIVIVGFDISVSLAGLAGLGIGFVILGAILIADVFSSEREGRRLEALMAATILFVGAYCLGLIIEAFYQNLAR